MVLWPRGPCLIPFARGSGASFDGGKVLFARLAGPRLYRGRVPFARGVFIHKGLSDGERVRGAPRRAPDTPGSRLPANKIAAARFPRLRFLASGRPGYGILPFPTSGPRPCGPDLARQFRLGDFDAGPNTPNFEFFMFYRTVFVAER